MQIFRKNKVKMGAVLMGKNLQGSLPETFGDFWRMIWEQRSATVVMMTKLEERSRVRITVDFFENPPSIIFTLCISFY